jgi:hypothetical protein
MASAAHHYREAERLLAEAVEMGDIGHSIARAKVAAAQVHATLAECARGDVIVNTGHLGTEQITRAEREATRDSITAQLTGKVL